MKRTLYTLLFLFAATITSATAQVRFETGSTDSVRALALKQNKLVLIDLYATWCQPCRMMQSEVFTRRDVGDYISARFVAAKYDTDRTTGKTLLSRYGSGAIPLYLIFNTEGDLLGRIEGACDAQTLLDNLEEIVRAQKSKPKKD